MKPKHEVWKHFIILNKDSDTKKIHASCQYCSNEYKMASATRLKKHLMNCDQCPEEFKKHETLKYKDRSYEKSKDTNQGIHDPLADTSMAEESFELNLPTCESVQNLQFSTPKSELNTSVAGLNSRKNIFETNFEESDSIEQQHSKKNQANKHELGATILTPSSFEIKLCPPNASMENNVQILHVESSLINIDDMLARALYSSSAPLSLLENKNWKSVFEHLHVHVPNIQDLTTSLLEDEYVRVHNSVTTKINNSDTLTLISDGWTSENGKGLVSFVITTPQPVYYKSVFLADIQRETSAYLGEEITNVIEEVGKDKFVALITDNASNLNAAWQKVNSYYPHIACLVCASHSLDLLCGGIVKIPVLNDTLCKVVEVINEIKSSKAISSRFEKIQHEVYTNVKCNLNVFEETQSNGSVMTLHSYRNNKAALETLAKTNVLSTEARDSIFDKSLWIKIEKCIIILRPITNALSHLNSASATLSDVPAVFQELYDNVIRNMDMLNICTTQEMHDVKIKIMKMKEYCIKPVHIAANVLDPRYLGVHVLSQIPVALQFLHNLASLILMYRDEDLGKLNEDIAQFRTKSGYYGISNAIWAGVDKIAPNVWWRTFAPTQALFPLAVRLLSIPPSSVASGRRLGLIGSKRMEKEALLDNESFHKLIFIKANLRSQDSNCIDAENAEYENPMGYNDSIKLNNTEIDELNGL